MLLHKNINIASLYHLCGTTTRPCVHHRNAIYEWWLWTVNTMTIRGKHSVYAAAVAMVGSCIFCYCFDRTNTLSEPHSLMSLIKCYPWSSLNLNEINLIHFAIKGWVIARSREITRNRKNSTMISPVTMNSHTPMHVGKALWVYNKKN